MSDIRKRSLYPWNMQLEINGGRVLMSSHINKYHMADVRLFPSVSLFLLLILSGCLFDDASIDIADDGNDDESQIEIEIRGNANLANQLDIGFNVGRISFDPDDGPDHPVDPKDERLDQFDFYRTFFEVNKKKTPHLCHAYFQWNVATQKPTPSPGPDCRHVHPLRTRDFVDCWLEKARGVCDEVLVSFQNQIGPAHPPSLVEYTDAFEKFVENDWVKETGYDGEFSFTPWNEPNNPGRSGNGLIDVAIDPRTAADYYLIAEASCRLYSKDKRYKHCKEVAAGDFASNGNDFPKDFEQKCSDDDIAPAKLCKSANYIDKYKNEIANKNAIIDKINPHHRSIDERSKQLIKRIKQLITSLHDGFRPSIFAFHGWHDTNEYLYNSDNCMIRNTCMLQQIQRSLRGWANVDLWDTEDGIGQRKHVSVSDNKQADGAAFLLQLQSSTHHIKRLYVTRLYGSTMGLIGKKGEKVNDLPPFEKDTVRPALCVLAKRKLKYKQDESDFKQCLNSAITSVSSLDGSISQP